MAPERCIKRNARTVARTAKCRSSRLRGALYIAGTASRSIALRESSEQELKYAAPRPGRTVYNARVFPGSNFFIFPQLAATWPMPYIMHSCMPAGIRFSVSNFASISPCVSCIPRPTRNPRGPRSYLFWMSLNSCHNAHSFNRVGSRLSRVDGSIRLLKACAATSWESGICGLSRPGARPLALFPWVLLSFL